MSSQDATDKHLAEQKREFEELPRRYPHSPDAMAAMARKHGEALAAPLDEARRKRDWQSYLNWHGHEDRLDGFLEILPDLDTEPSEVYWSLLTDVWSSSECPAARFDEWDELLRDHRPGREAMTPPEDLDALAALPDPVRIYRGVGHPRYAEGFSWTLDRALAEWFARRASVTAFRGGVQVDEDEEPVLVCATVARADVIALLDAGARNEAEVVVLPESVTVVRQEAVEQKPPLSPAGARLRRSERST